MAGQAAVNLDLPILLAIVAMALCLLLIPLGLPGTWLMLAVLGIAVWKAEMAWWLWLLLVVVAGIAEIAEFFIVQRTSERYGGSRRAFWGAILGGIAGVLVGLPIPVPVLGSLVAGLLGTFAGAAIVTLLETRRLGAARRVAWGALIGRALAAAAKTAAGIVILVIGSASLILS